MHISLTGQLFFEEESLKPLHHVRVEFIAQDCEHPLVTDTEISGCFLIEGEASGELSQGLLRCFIPWPKYDEQNKPIDDWHLIYENAVECEKLCVGNASQGHAIASGDSQHYRLPDIPISYWRYHPSSPTPRLHPELVGPLYDFSEATSRNAANLLAEIEPIHQQHQRLNRYTPSQPSLRKIQAAYPPSKSMLLDQEQPDHSRSDAYFGHRVLNGMCASNLDRHPDNPTQLWLYHHWQSYTAQSEYQLPNIDMRFALKNEQLIPTAITLFMRNQQTDEVERCHFCPEDGAGWENAKHAARVSLMLQAEIDSHLTTTHLNLEQYAIPIYRNIRLNPLRRLLYPHLKEVVAANRQADHLLLGIDGFIARGSALPTAAIEKRITHVLGGLDWANWAPRAPLCESHRFAHVANLYWEILGDFVDAFFAEYQSRIAAHWNEVFLFSQELVTRAMPAFLCQHMQHTLNQSPIPNWFNPNERIKVNLTHSGSTAITPVTTRQTPNEADLVNLKQLCRYIIMHATFLHSWANLEQYADTGEIAFAGLGLRFNGAALTEKFTKAQLPPPRVALDQPYLAYFLSEVKHGFVMNNEDRDIHPDLINRLEQHRGQFSALGFDVDEISSRINI